MKSILLFILSAVVLTGCATTDWSSATPEQRMMAFQAMQNTQARPTYTPIQPYQMSVPAQTHCNTTYIGNQAYTNCSTY